MSLKRLSDVLFGRAMAGHAFEPLEERCVLAAAVYAGTSVHTTDWTIVVRYTDPQGINTSTLGNNDIRVTGPGGYNQLGVLQSFTRDYTGSDTSIRAVYKLPAAGTAWDYSDNGHYTLSTVAGGVTDSTGEQVPATNLHTFSLWFSTPKVEVLNATTNGDQFIVNLKYSDNTGIDAATIGFAEVGLTRLSNNSTTWVRSQAFFQNADGSWTVTYRLPAVGGVWDYSDNGHYVLKINGNQVRDLDSPGNAIPAQDLKTYSLWWSNPKVEYVSTGMSRTDWVVTVRYTDPEGINLSSIGAGDIRVTNGFITIQGTPVGSPTQESSTSVLVKYRIWDGFGFGAGDNGSWKLMTNAGAVTDGSGVGIHAGTFKTFGLWFDQPSISRPPAQPTITSNSMELTVTYTDNTGINFSSVGNNDLVILGPSGYGSYATLISKTTRVDSLGRTVVDAKYRFARPVVSGLYTVTMRQDQVFDTGGNPVSSFVWARFNLNV